MFISSILKGEEAVSTPEMHCL